MNARRWIAVPLLMAASAQASEWTVSPSVYSRAELADNPRLAVDARAASGAVTDASVELRRRTEDSDWVFAPAIQYREFTGDETLGGSDESARLALTHTGEFDVWSMEMNWSRESTRTSELGTTGFTQTNKQRRDTDMTLGLSHMMSDRVTLTANVFGSDTRYRDARWTGLIDYQYYATSLAGSFVATERLQLSVEANAGRLEAPDLADAGTTQYGVTLRTAYGWSPQWRISAYAGPSRVVGTDAEDDGAAFGVSLTRQGERSSFSGSLSRAVKPTGRGVLVRQDALSISHRMQLSERLAAELNATGLRSDDAVRSESAESVKYLQLGAGLLWDCTPNLRLRLNAARSTQKHTDRATYEASNHTVSLGLAWTPTAITFWH